MLEFVNFQTCIAKECLESCWRHGRLVPWIAPGFPAFRKIDRRPDFSNEPILVPSDSGWWLRPLQIKKVESHNRVDFGMWTQMVRLSCLFIAVIRTSYLRKLKAILQRTEVVRRDFSRTLHRRRLSNPRPPWLHCFRIFRFLLRARVHCLLNQEMTTLTQS